MGFSPPERATIWASARVALLLFAGLSLLPFGWLIASHGWPANHESLRIYRRLAIFAGQWAAGNLFPVWSTTAFGGHGSPSPIIYNKLFNILSAGWWEVLGDARLAICASFVLLGFMTFLGMALCCRVMLGRRDLAIEAASGVLALYSVYATTDWLTRGAVAEYAAFALVPWLLAWCLRLVLTGTFGIWIGPLMALICLAHASIALYCVLPVGLAVMMAKKASSPFLKIRTKKLLSPRRADADLSGRSDAVMPAKEEKFFASFFQKRSLSALSLYSRSLLALTAFSALIGPVALATLPYPKLVSFELLGGITPAATHLPFIRLLWDTPWFWGTFVPYFTVQIDPALLLAGLVLAVLVARAPLHRRAALFLLALSLAVLFLQTRQALFVYRIVPGAKWLQFSFRLLVFLVPALALCGGLVLDRLRNWLGPGAVWAAFCAILLAMSAGKPWLGHAPDKVFSDADIAAAAVDERSAPEPWEYYPYPLDLHLTMDGALKILEPAASTPCLGRPLDDMHVEHASARFAVSCPGGGVATLPITMAPGMRFVIADAPVPAFRRCPDIHPKLALTGDAVVTVVFPNFMTALEAAVAGHSGALLCR